MTIDARILLSRQYVKAYASTTLKPVLVETMSHALAVDWNYGIGSGAFWEPEALLTGLRAEGFGTENIQVQHVGCSLVFSVG